MADDKNMASQAAEYFEKMTGALGLETTATGTCDEKKIVLSVKTDDPGRLIGRRGRILNNFDYLLNRIMSAKSESQVRVVIDVEGGKRDRPSPKKSAEASTSSESNDRPSEDSRQDQGEDDRLQQLALDAAKEVKRWGDPKTIGPFNAGERRIIHAALQTDASVQAESGEELRGNRKKMTISLASEK